MVPIDHGVEHAAVDDAQAAVGGEVQGGAGEAVDVAQPAGAGFVQQGEGGAAKGEASGRSVR